MIGAPAAGRRPEHGRRLGGVLSQGEAFDLLVGACPSFFASHRFDDYVASFEEEDTPDVFVRVGALAHHVVELAAAGDAEELPGVFAALERILVEGDGDAKELAVLGLVEDLQNICSHPDVPVAPTAFVPLLGERTLEVWAEQDELWQSAGRWRQADAPEMTDEDYAGIGNEQLRRYVQLNYRVLPGGARISVPDVLRYQTDVARISPITPAGRPRFSWTWVAVGAVLLVATFLALWG